MKNITVGKALQNVFSQKYDKKNLGIYLLIAIAILCPLKFIELPSYLIFCVFALLFVIGIFVTWGFIFKSYNNAIKHYRNGVFPNIISDFKNIITIGFKHFFAMIISSLFFLGLVPAILGIVLALILPSAMANNSVLIMTIIIALAIFTFVVYIDLLLTYICIAINAYISLNWKDWLNYKRGSFLRKKANATNRAFFRFVWRVFIISAIFSIPGTISDVLGKILPETEKNTMILASIDMLSLAFALIATVLCIDLTAQFINEVLPNLGKKKRPRPIVQSE